MTNFEGQPTQEPAPFNPEDIIWNPNQTVIYEFADHEPILVDEAMIERGKAVIGLLLTSGGKPVEFTDNEYATNLPTIYELTLENEGIEVEFLPHWGFYKLRGKVGEIQRTIPQDSRTINHDLQAAKNETARLLSEESEE